MPMTGRFTLWKWAALGFLVLLLAAAWWWRGDILQTTLDPKVPFQTYSPPKAPNYGDERAWLAMPDDDTEILGTRADVFFLAPTAFAGGEDWNAPLDDPKMLLRLNRDILPNYAGPFAEVGPLYAPLYRQASVYTSLTTREDAREARIFAYQDVERAFQLYLDQHNMGRPFVLVGIEQGGLHALRLLSDKIVGTPLQKQMVAAYVLQHPVPVDLMQSQLAGLRVCETSLQTQCLISWGEFLPSERRQRREFSDRGYVWDAKGSLTSTEDRALLCINPILWTRSIEYAPARLHAGGVNATGLEAGASPPPLPGQTSAQCVDGTLSIDAPRAPSLQRTGGWLDRHMVPSFNLFYADIKRDAERRVMNWYDDPNTPKPVQTLSDSIEIDDAPIHTID